MRKIITLPLLAMLVIFALSGCSQAAQEGTAQAGQQNEAAVSGTSALPGSEAEAAAGEDADKVESEVQNAEMDEVQSDTGAEEPDEVSETASNMLVAYFSAMGTTKGVAEKIAEITGADIYEIEPAEPYSDDDLNYSDGNSRATVEQNDSSSRPEIAGAMENFDAYDTVFFGYPIWWGDAAHIMFTFAESYDFVGKTIIPFCTSGSSPIGSSASNIESHANGGTWLEGKRMSGDTTEQEISEWIASLGIGTDQTEVTDMEEEETMRITVKSGSYEISYELNDSKAAESLYLQLPLTLEQEDFSNNEKTFYPPEKLAVTDAPLAEGGSGVLAYYEPWGDVVMFYGDFSRNSGLYELGRAVSGEENISQISGTIEIDKAD